MQGIYWDSPLIPSIPNSIVRNSPLESTTPNKKMGGCAFSSCVMKSVRSDFILPSILANAGLKSRSSLEENQLSLLVFALPTRYITSMNPPYFGSKSVVGCNKKLVIKNSSGLEDRHQISNCASLLILSTDVPESIVASFHRFTIFLTRKSPTRYVAAR